MKPSIVPLTSIRLDGGTQARVSMSDAVIDEYADACSSLALAAAMPPVVLFHDGADYWLADGFYRYSAAQRRGHKNIKSDVRDGTQRDAILYSLGANAHHGLRRTNADKRRAVETLLADAEWGKWPLRKVAEAAGVSHELVALVKNDASTVDKKHPDDRAEPAKDSRLDSQPEVSSSFPRNQREGETGAGVANAAPAPREPDAVLLSVERAIRDAQAELAPLLIAGRAGVTALLARLNDALDACRIALQPPVEPRRDPVRVAATRERIAKLRIEDDQGNSLEPMEDSQ